MIEIVHVIAEHVNVVRLDKFLSRLHMRIGRKARKYNKVFMYYTCPDCDSYMLIMGRNVKGQKFRCFGCLKRWFKALQGGSYIRLKKIPKQWKKKL